MKMTTVAILCALAGGAEAATSRLLAINATGSLYEMDLNHPDRPARLVRSLSDFGFQGLEYVPGDALYAITYTRNLYRINPDTYASQFLGSMSLADAQFQSLSFTKDLSWNPATRQLEMLGMLSASPEHPAGAYVFSLDTSTRAARVQARLVGPGVDSGEVPLSLGTDSQGRRMMMPWAGIRTRSVVDLVGTNPLTVTPRTVQLPPVYFDALVVDWRADGRAYSYQLSRIQEVRADGSLVPVMSAAMGDSVGDLAFVPSPAAWMLGAAALVCTRRRRS